MRIKDVVAGRRYAMGSASRYDIDSLIEVEVLEVAGERTLGGASQGRRMRGLVVRVVDYRGGMFLSGARTTRTVDPDVVMTQARYLQAEWGAYVETRERRRVDREEKIAVRYAERARVRAAVLALVGLGLEAVDGGRDVRLSVRSAEALARRLESLEAGA